MDYYKALFDHKTPILGTKLLSYYVTFLSYSYPSDALFRPPQALLEIRLFIKNSKSFFRNQGQSYFLFQRFLPHTFHFGCVTSYSWFTEVIHFCISPINAQ